MNLNEKATELESEFPGLKTELKELSLLGAGGETEIYSYLLVSNLPGNPQLELQLKEEEDFDRFRILLGMQPNFFTDLVGYKNANEIFVLVGSVGKRSSVRTYRRRVQIDVNVSTHYHQNDISLRLTVQPPESLPNFFIQQARQVRSPSRSPLIVQISGLNRPTSLGIEVDIRSIVSSMLFDLECVYGLSLEVVSFNSIQVPRRRYRKRYPPLPTTTVPMVHKKYIPELLEYYHAGEKVDYLPFKYICYFHVIEYFSDKSAYHAVASAIRSMFLRPDFHLKMDSYVDRAVKIVKKESQRTTTDKVKISRVLRHYINNDDIKSFLDESELTDHFEKSQLLSCAKPLELPALDLSSDSSLIDTLTRRIYSLRCSIVHSNPDFEGSKAVPFITTTDNLDILRTEIELISEVARTVIIRSANT